MTKRFLKISIGAVAVLAGFGVVGNLNRTAALTYQDNVDLQFTFEPSLTIDLSSDLIIEDLAPGSASDSNVITITTSTNNVTGCTLSASTGNGTTYTDTKLINGTAYFTSLATDANISGLNNINTGYWGYAYSSDNGTTWSNYSGLPYYSTTPKELAVTNTNGTSSINFKIAAVADSWQASGEYNNVINFYAVTNAIPEPTPTMQDMTLAECPTEPTDAIDSRDDTTYKVQKLADGNCWMLDNLALDITNSTVKSKMTTSTTNATAQALSCLKTGKYNSTTCSSPYTGTAVSSSWSDSYNTPRINTASINTVPSNPPASGSGSNKVGVYYNYCAASAGSYCYASGSSSGNASYDICPKGWHLPTGNSSGQFATLYSNSSYNNYTNFKTALSLPLSGLFYSGSARGQGSNGAWWSSTRRSDDCMYNLYLSTSSVVTAYNDDRGNGYPIRCVKDS